jgi:hypothetical protein
MNDENKMMGQVNVNEGKIKFIFSLSLYGLGKWIWQDSVRQI